MRHTHHDMALDLNTTYLMIKGCSRSKENEVFFAQPDHLGVLNDVIDCLDFMNT